MGKYYILYNPYASNGTGEQQAKKVLVHLKNETATFIDMTRDDTDYSQLFAKMEADDKLILCGGDGTLNRFINDCDARFPDVDIYLFPTGTGNDFLKDIGLTAPCGPVLITPYLQNLPVVEINGEKHYFLDNVAFGIDGWVCEVADQIKEKDKSAKINYTKIAISGLLGKYSPCNATVIVDGEEHHYSRVWMAPTMNGRYFGGGMMVTPMQDRLDKDRKITVMLFQNGNRLQIATGFPAIFSGKHVKNKRAVFIQGNDVTVEFDSPRAVQIDGETILGVLKYHAYKK